MSNSLDLDALQPEAATIVFQGKEIKVNPPSTAQILELSKLGGDLTGGKELPEDQIEPLFKKLSDFISTLIPELEDANLNFKQIMGIVDLISEMVMPPDSKELTERGIKPVDSSQKAE